MKRKFGLVILDGFGYGKQDHTDAVFNAKTPVFDRLVKNFPNATLTTFGEAVGLPEGQMGNSEVGHMNIGAGRVVYQDFTRINKAIREGDLYENKELNHAIQLAKEQKSALHVFGLISKGGVHSHQDHAVAVCNYASKQGVETIYVHAFTDGRDCDPHSGRDFLAEFQDKIKDSNAQVVSVCGRYYAMDRDKRWERVSKAYQLIVNGVGEKFPSVDAVFENSYSNEITDEFLLPAIIENEEINYPGVQAGDIMLCFNFRNDRPREIVTMLSQQDFPENNTKAMQVEMFSMTLYDATFKNVHILFEKQNLQNTLGEVVSKAGGTQLRTAETEKYPHVTFFFNGGREVPFDGEERILVHSPKVATYDLQPEMSAPEVTEKAIKFIQEKQPDFICLNFANPDMVGHTGVFDAIVKACETVDTCLGKLIEASEPYAYEWLVIADHGNADNAINPDGTPNTQHSVNPVPVILVTSDAIQIHKGILADVAPTILERMGITLPAEMDGKSLVE